MTFLNQPKQLLKLKKQILIRLYVPKRFPSLSYHVKCAIHAKRVTIMPKDIQLARRIRGERA